MTFQRFIFLILFVFGCQCACTQGVKGRLTDESNQPVPFAAIYDEVTHAGTTSNGDGYYELRLPPGRHSLVYKTLGFYLERRTPETGSTFMTIDIVMKVQVYELKDVIVTPGKEDPAYSIMRKVISRAPYHLNQVKEYAAEVYLRGTIHVIHIPKIIARNIEVNGKKGAIKDGDVFLEESVNQIEFKAPDHYVQKVKSFRTNFPGENDVNPMQVIRSSFYQPTFDGLISPLAPNAFNYYKYRYEGFFRDGNQVVFKIRVDPKRDSQQLLRGYIFVMDQLWCLHSVDMAQEMFFGNLKYKGVFSPVRENVWLPISFLITADASMLGVKGDYKYTSSVKYSSIQLNEKPQTDLSKSKPVISGSQPKVNPAKSAPATRVAAKQEKKKQEVDKLMEKENLTNREMIKLAGLMANHAEEDTSRIKNLNLSDEHIQVTIEKDAVKKDTAFWTSIRPIPLSGVEAQIGIPAESGKDSIAGKDSSRMKKNKGNSKMMKLLMGGATASMFDSTTQITYDGLVNPKNFGFNTVDGLIIRQSIHINIHPDSLPMFYLNPGISWAFSRKDLMWWVNTGFQYLPMKCGNFNISYRSGTTDFNTQGGMSGDLNSLVSLFFRRNYKKFYDEEHLTISNTVDLANGLTLKTSLRYREARMVENNSDFSFFYQKTRDYTSNIPVPEFNLSPAYADHKAAYLKIGLEYTPEYYYRIWKGRKYYQRSKYPTLILSYLKAIPGIMNSTASFDYMEGGLRQSIDWGLMHSLSWLVIAGKYLNQDKLFVTDYKYFNNQPLPIILENSKNAFFLTDSYQNYNHSAFIEGHLTFSTPYLFVKYLPFLEDKIWQENLMLNYLHTGGKRHYWEAGYSISQIYAVGTIGVFAGFENKDFKNAGIKLILNLN